MAADEPFVFRVTGEIAPDYRLRSGPDINHKRLSSNFHVIAGDYGSVDMNRRVGEIRIDGNRVTRQDVILNQLQLHSVARCILGRSSPIQTYPWRKGTYYVYQVYGDLPQLGVVFDVTPPELTSP